MLNKYLVGNLYYVTLLDQYYIEVKDSKGIKCIYHPSTAHFLPIRLGIRIVSWTEGFPSEDELDVWQMINTTATLNREKIKDLRLLVEEIFDEGSLHKE